MKLVLKTVRPHQGVQWITQSWRLFGRAPLALTGLLGTFLFVALLAMFIPVVGGIVVVVLLPMLSLVMMMGSAAALRGQLVPPSLLLAPLRADDLRRRRLLAMGGLYAAGTLLILLMADGLDGGKFAELQQVMSTGLESEDQRRQAQALLEDGQLRDAMILRLVLTALLSVPFWYAPALVWWGGQGVAQSLFSSVLALWRSRGAFLVYLAAWITLLALGGSLLGVVLQALGAGQLLGALAMPLGLTLSVVFYVSLYFMFVQTFGTTVGPEGETPDNPDSGPSGGAAGGAAQDPLNPPGSDGPR
jgi:hypothetical protein